MAKTLTLRLNDEQDEALQLLINNSLAISTASKMLVYCMDSYPVFRSQIDDLYARIDTLERKNQALEKIISDARISAYCLWDKVAQEDFIDSMD